MPARRPARRPWRRPPRSRRASCPAARDGRRERAPTGTRRCSSRPCPPHRGDARARASRRAIGDVEHDGARGPLHRGRAGVPVHGALVAVERRRRLRGDDLIMTGVATGAPRRDLGDGRLGGERDDQSCHPPRPARANRGAAQGDHHQHGQHDHRVGVEPERELDRLQERREVVPDGRVDEQDHEERRGVRRAPPRRAAEAPRTAAARAPTPTTRPSTPARRRDLEPVRRGSRPRCAAGTYGYGRRITSSRSNRQELQRDAPSA